MKFYCFMFGIFMSGMVVAIQLTILLGSSPTYVAGWEKVAAAVLLALIFSEIARRQRK